MVHSQTLWVRLARQVIAMAALSCLTLQVAAAQEAVRTGGLARLRSCTDRFVKNASASVSPGAPTREALAKQQNPICDDSVVLRLEGTSRVHLQCWTRGFAGDPLISGSRNDDVWHNEARGLPAL